MLGMKTEYLYWVPSTVGSVQDFADKVMRRYFGDTGPGKERTWGDTVFPSGLSGVLDA